MNAAPAKREEVLIAVERAVLRELLHSWHEFNRELFEGRLGAPVLRTHRGRSLLGQWRAEERTISISLDFILEDPWLRVLTVLKHEMAHQFINEGLGVVDAADHGPLFRRICEQKNLESDEEVGLGAGKAAPEARIVELVRKLLSLAGSPNRHEAESAMRKAGEMMLRWNIESLAADRGRRFMVAQLGSAKGRIGIAEKRLSRILQDFFFVEAIWVGSYDARRGKRGRVLEICGTPENVEIADYVHHYLMRVGDMHWREYRRANPDSDRRNYIYGLMVGFHEKLEAERGLIRESTAIVWKGDPLLEKYFRKRHPRTRAMAASTLALCRRSMEEGKKRGRTVVIHKGIEKAADAGRMLGRGEGRLLGEGGG